QFGSVPLMIFFRGFNALDPRSISALDLANIFLYPIGTLLSYVGAVLASRMSRRLGIAFLAIGVPITLMFLAVVGVLSWTLWGEFYGTGGVPMGGIGRIVGFMILVNWMWGTYLSIFLLKAGYRYVVSDNFIRMLVADSYEKCLFSL